MSEDEENCRGNHRPKVHFLVTHPVQYYAPWYRALHRSGEIEMKVWFSFLPDAVQQGTGFGVAFEWDVPLLEGYPWEVLPQPAEGDRPMSFERWGDIRNSEMIDTFRRDRPDVMVINGWNYRAMVQGLVACRRLGIPVIVRGEANAMRVRPWMVRVVHRMLLSRYAACLAIGKSGAEFYRNNGVPDARIFRACYFIDNEHFANGCAEADRGELRRRWKVADDAFCFVFVGKLELKKRILDLLAAMDLLADKPCHLLIAGGGEQEVEAKRLVEENKLKVTFCGFLNQSELPSVYAAADALALPSDYGETWGLVVNEAMACGLPVVISDRIGCGPDLVQDGVTGQRFSFSNVRELAQAMALLVDDREASAEMGRRALEKIADFNAGQAAEGALEAIRYVMKGNE